MVSENEIMEEKLIEIDNELASELNFDNILILVLSGTNTEKAMLKLGKLIARPPIIIALHSEPTENSDEIDYTHEVDTNCIREMIRTEKEIKKAEVTYIKHFIKKITEAMITSIEDVESIHREAQLKMARECPSNRVKALIEIHECNYGIKLQYTQGVYRDLSQGYERNNNIENKYYEENILMRRWQNMTQFYRYLREGSSIPANG
jgi:hypothetical protein